MILTLTILVMIGLVIVLKTTVVVPARENLVKERLGKFAGVLPPGIHFLLPFFDRISYRHEMREQVIEIPPQNCITRDNIQVEVDGIVYLKVMDPRQASYGIENYQVASINLAQTTMRSEIGKLTLHQSFSERESLNQTVVEEIDKASSPWGIKMLRYEIMNITPTPGVIHTLEQAMQAERERRAEVTLATAAKEAMIQVSEGEKQEAINLSEGEKQKRINEAEGKAGEISIIAEAAAYGLKRIGKAIERPEGRRAVKMRISEQYIDEFGKILESANVSVVPSGYANIKGFFEGIARTSATMSDISTPTPHQ